MKEKLVDRVGGLDLAVRVDTSAFFCLDAKYGFVKKLESNTIFLEEHGKRVWRHIDYDIIADDMLAIQRQEKMSKIGYDRTGVGDGVRKLFHKSIPLNPIVASQQTKFDIITKINGLFHQGRLIIHTQELYDELIEQEKYVSDAGNLLYRHPQGFHDDRFWGLGFAVETAESKLRGMPRMTAAVASGRRNLNDELDAIMKDI